MTQEFNSEQLSRRKLFRNILGSTKKASNEIQNELFKRKAPRPPNCVDEVLLEKLCNGCGECEKVCPQRVLKLVDEKPQLHLDCNFCTHCGDCVKVCNTGALANSSHSTGVAPVFSDQCQRLLFGKCEICKVSCSKKAIQTEQKRPDVLQQQCNGCGECRLHCPISAISFELIAISQS